MAQSDGQAWHDMTGIRDARGELRHLRLGERRGGLDMERWFDGPGAAASSGAGGQSVGFFHFFFFFFFSYKNF